ncbi:hypothetical protein PIB30_082571, partial [Stylosanthes scabra]|nr:hypothetical protein [Stylosanthes scabra]
PSRVLPSPLPRLETEAVAAPPLQPEVVVLTSIAASEVGFVASHFASRLKSSRSQEHHRSVSSSVVSSPSPWSHLSELSKLWSKEHLNRIILETNGAFIAEKVTSSSF